MAPTHFTMLSSSTRIVAFASSAVLSATQDLVRGVLPALTDDADPELVAEETLVLVSVVTARAVEVGLKDAPEAMEAAGQAVLELPFLYHDYLLGGRMVAEGSEGDVEVDQAVYDRMARKAEFYGVHFPVGRFPGPHALAEKLPLWMGRISPPKLPTSPDKRLADLGLVEMLNVHVRLVLAFAQRSNNT
ncbi:MAG: hypothetical protein IIB09_08900 [Bacteroidetes bacterium]|nr:hypothetical protein [Bacteroidota bacterium]